MQRERKHPAAGWGRAALLALGVWSMLAVLPRLDQGSVRQDELECEEAVAWLKRCCPNHSQQIACIYDEDGPADDQSEDYAESDRGCSSEALYPDIPPYSSQCLRRMSCAQLRSSGACEQWGDAC